MKFSTILCFFMIQSSTAVFTMDIDKSPTTPRLKKSAEPTRRGKENRRNQSNVQKLSENSSWLAERHAASLKERSRRSTTTKSFQELLKKT